MKFLANLILSFNQLTQVVLERMTTATLADLLTIRAQIGYNDTTNKIVYYDGTAVQNVASESYVTGQVAAGSLAIAPSSTNLLDITGGLLSVKPLLIQRTFTDVTSTTLAIAIAARTPVYNLANIATADLQEGDVLILSAATGGMQIYIHNGGVAGTTADFTIIETPNLDNAAIRALFNGGNGIIYNNVTGWFVADESYLTNTLYNFTGGITRDGFTKNVFLDGFLIGGRELILGTTTFNIRNSRGNGYGFYLNNQSGQTSAKFGDSSVNLERNDIGMQFNGLGGIGITYATVPTVPTNNTLIHKGYVDGVAAKRSTQTVTTVANTFLTITHNFALADKDAIQVALWEAGKMVLAEVETVNANSIRIRTGSAITGLKVFLTA